MQLKSSEFLLNIRICFSSIVVGHLVFAAIVLLPIDMTQDEDPRISAYYKLKWKLLTCWFNLMIFYVVEMTTGPCWSKILSDTIHRFQCYLKDKLCFKVFVPKPWMTNFGLLLLVYFPISIYCDWKQKKGEWNNKGVRKLRNVKDILMTSILFPTIMYSDYFFWRMWYKDPSLIAPIGIFKYLPSWGQHSLHTASGLTVVLDILLTPRRRPDSILPGSMLMFAFCALYSLVLTVSYYNGDVVYNVIEIFNKQQIILLISLAFIEHIFFFTLQWCIIDLVHGKQVKNTKKRS